MKLHLQVLLGTLLAAGVIVSAAEPTVPTTQESPPDTASTTVPATGEVGDLRDLIGINHDFTRVEMGNMPEMSMRGFIQPGNPAKLPTALLEIKQMKRLFLVQEGTEIPVMVTGRVTPVARNELSGLHGDAKAAATPSPASDSQQQSQIILKVVKVSAEGVIVKAGLQAQTIIIR